MSVAFFFLGAIVASFVGVVVVRLNTGEPILVGRSRCDACGVILSPFSLVPLLSFIASHGRALCCGVRLSLYEPLSELVLGGLFVGAYLALGLTLALPFFLAALSLLAALVLYDLAHQILPPTLLVPLVAVCAVTGYLLSPSLQAFVFSLLTALSIGAVLALIHFLSRGRAMGFADVPLSFGLSLLVGEAAVPGIVFSFWVGAVIGIAVLFTRPKGSRMGIEVPFAPYLAAGFLLAFFTQWNPFLLLAASP